MDTELLNVLRCPETGGVLRIADPAELQRINAEIVRASIKNRGGELINESLEECLVCDSAGLCYPVREGLPMMLAGEAFVWPV
jgi:uncharacterized protein